VIINYHDNGWRKRFALLPIRLSDGPNHQIVWLQWVWKRDMGLFVAVRLTDPAITQAEGPQA